MRFAILWSSFAAAVFAATPAGASNVNYNTEAWCQEVASVGGNPSYVIYESCLRMERSAKQALTGRRVDAGIFYWCDEVATLGGPGSYQQLKSCIDMEEAARQRSGARF